MPVPKHSANLMLIEATGKLLELHKDSKWAKQLLLRCPPVLWFGNATSSKPKILTIGANPSRKEFLKDTPDKAMEKVSQTGDQSRLSYLEPPHNRFRLLSDGETLADILTVEKTQEQIIASYNGYFTHNPYRTWFGHDRDNSYKVEGFLRGFGASYYDEDTLPQQAIHIDLFPFATIANFRSIKEMADAAFFADGWAKCMLCQLVEYLSPAACILFGRTNCEYFGQVDHSVDKDKIAWQKHGKAEYFIGHSENFGVPIVGLSTNLGNPKGFDASGLRQYGEQMAKSVRAPVKT